MPSERWGPGLTDDSPGLDVPHDWRSTVADLPHEAWVRWRARSGELQAALGETPTVREVREADRLAAAEMGIDTAGPRFDPSVFARAMDPELDPHATEEREAIQAVEAADSEADRRFLMTPAAWRSTVASWPPERKARWRAHAMKP